MGLQVDPAIPEPGGVINEHTGEENIMMPSKFCSEKAFRKRMPVCMERKVNLHRSN